MVLLNAWIKTQIFLHGVRVFANGPGDLGSIPGRVIPKTQKMVLDTSLLNTQHYKVRIKGKVEQFREGVAPSPTPWCSSYRKGSLRVTLDYGRQLYFTYLHNVQDGCWAKSFLHPFDRSCFSSSWVSKPLSSPEKLGGGSRLVAYDPTMEQVVQGLHSTSSALSNLTYMRTYIYIYIYTHIHTYIHTHKS